MSEKIRYLSPEEEAHEQRVNQQIEELKAQVEQDKQRRRAQREQKEKQDVIASKRLEEENKRHRENQWIQTCEGLDKEQIEILKQLYALEPRISASSGYSREDLKAEYDILLKRFIDKGRSLGTMSFIPLIVYISITGNGLLLPNTDGSYSYRAGTFGAFETTNKLLECDPKTKQPLRIIQPSPIEKSSIPIQNYWHIKILEKVPEPEPNKPYDLNFLDQDKLKEQARPQTPKELEEKKKKLGVF